MNQDAINIITAAANAALTAQEARNALAAAEKALHSHERHLSARLLQANPVSVQVGGKIVTVTGDPANGSAFEYTVSTLAGPVSK